MLDVFKLNCKLIEGLKCIVYYKYSLMGKIFIWIFFFKSINMVKFFNYF